MVEIRSLDELREVDERTLSFSPFGLGGKMAAHDAARFQQEAVSHPELAPAVPQRVRDCVDRLRMTHAYGVLHYDFFTIAHDQAQLALEFALRERFAELQGSTAQFRDEAGKAHDIATTPFRDLQAEVRRHEEDVWRLVVHRTGATVRFDGMLDSLLRWAREEGLLRGQVNRARDRALRDMRDHVAHGAGDHLLMPVNSARAIGDVVEIVNQLWGAATPGGRMYPAPIRREILIVGWSPRGEVMAGAAGPPPGEDPADGRTWVIVRAVPHDEGLMRFDSLFEVTEYPCELLWGPGSAADAVAWVERERPLGDTVEVLDRLFLVQYYGDRLYFPRRPEIALGLVDSERAGTWSLIRADSDSSLRPCPQRRHGRGRVLSQGTLPAVCRGDAAQGNVAGDIRHPRRPVSAMPAIHGPRRARHIDLEVAPVPADPWPGKLGARRQMTSLQAPGLTAQRSA